MPYPTPTAAQTSANSTAWSLKKSNSFPFPRYKRGAEWLGAAGFPITNLRQPNRSDGRSAQCNRAHVVRLRADLRDRREEQLAQARIVLLEHPDDLRGGHRRPAFDPVVVIGDHRDRRVAELELPGEHALGIGGHVDHVPAGLPEPVRLRPSREARALDDDHGAAVAGRDPELGRGLREEAPEV